MSLLIQEERSADMSKTCLCGTARAVVLESGLQTFIYRLGLVLDSLVFGLGLGHRTRQMFKLVSTESSNICFFFLFQNKTINLARLFRKWVM